jgi:hypothetical protein
MSLIAVGPRQALEAPLERFGALSIAPSDEPPENPQMDP